MEIALVIAGAVVLMTAFAAGFDFLSKRRARLDDQTRAQVQQMEGRVHALELAVGEKEQRISQLETELRFFSRLLDKKPE